MGVGRVLMTADGVGGVWTYALDLACGLRVHGITVTIATMGPRLSADQHGEAARRGIDVREGDYALEWMDDPWPDVDAAAGWLLALEDDCRPDVVHLNGYCHGMLPWRAPVVVAAHSCVASWWRGVHGGAAPSSWDTYRARVRDGLDGAAIVVAPTRAMLDALQREYGAVPNGRVIPNGRATSLPAEGGRHESVSGTMWLPPSGGGPSREFIFSAGRIWDQAKNIDALCGAAPRLRWPVYVAGDSGGAECRSSDAVRYLGRLPAGEMHEWLARASLYVLPARYEPFGLSVLEAASAGCALVLGDIASLRENWDGAAAFVDPDDQDALVRAIDDLIDDAALRRDMGARAHERSKGFTVERMALAYAALYEEIAALKGPRHDRRAALLGPPA
jgi:glycosyltransferase involved in cell wall biosynthesis